MSLIRVIQDIALNAVLAAKPAEFVTGTVTQINPLKVLLNGENGLEIGEDALVLTASVVQKTVTIQKHNHKIGSSLVNHNHAATLSVTTTTGEGEATGVTNSSSGLNSQTTVETTVVDAVCTEHGDDLETDSDDERIVITINRALEKDDKVLMIAVDCGQTYVIISRVFEHKQE